MSNLTKTVIVLAALTVIVVLCGAGSGQVGRYQMSVVLGSRTQGNWDVVYVMDTMTGEINRLSPQGNTWERISPPTAGK